MGEFKSQYHKRHNSIPKSAHCNLARCGIRVLVLPAQPKRHLHVQPLSHLLDVQ